MLKTEFSPLIPSKSKSRRCSFVSIVVLCIMAAFVVYYSSISETHPRSVSQSENNIFVNYPTQEELEEYRSKKVFIEYDMDEAPDTDDFGSAEMRRFHSNLIKEHGYNPGDHNINFIVSDARPVENPLDCKTMYAMSFSSGNSSQNQSSSESTSGFMELNCQSYFESTKQFYKTTGCVAYEVDSEGMRIGEGAYGSSDCWTDGTGPGLTILSGRCCKANKKIGLTVKTDQFVHSPSDYCLEHYCDYDNGYTAMGCGASVGNDSAKATDVFSGVKRILNEDSGETGCKAQRSESGDLFVQPYCGKVQKGHIRCKTIVTKEGQAELIRQGKWVARVSCDDGDLKNSGYELTDCSSEILSEMNSCDATAIAEGGDKGANFGAVLTRRRCVAYGSSENIGAIATCCTIVY